MTPFGFARIDLNSTGSATLVAVRGEDVVPLACLWGTGLAPETMHDLFDDWDHHVDHVARALSGGLPAGTLSPSAVRFLPPVDGSGSLYCAGANYYDHVAEMGAERPDKTTLRPFHFLLPAAALQGHHGDVIHPGVQQLDWEVELGAVIGRTTDRDSPDQALGAVAGYTIANDVSIRDPGLLRHPMFGVDFVQTKGLRTFQPLGPSIVPACFVRDPDDLRLRLSVNGESRQDSNTSEMIFSTAEQIAHLGASRSLLPGDVVLTGTPAGTATSHGVYLEVGDVMVAEIEGLGRLENRVI